MSRPRRRTGSRRANESNRQHRPSEPLPVGDELHAAFYDPAEAFDVFGGVDSQETHTEALSDVAALSEVAEQFGREHRLDLDVDMPESGAAEDALAEDDGPEARPAARAPRERRRGRSFSWWPFGRAAEPGVQTDPAEEVEEIEVAGPAEEIEVAEETEPAEEAAATEGSEPEEDVEHRAKPVRRRRAGRAHRLRAKDSDVASSEEPAADAPAREPSHAGEIFVRGARTTGTVALIIVVLMGALFGLVLGVNAFARWNARRVAALAGASAGASVDNLLVIGVRDGVAVGFTALKAERANTRVLGIAIPDGAFVEVPGQGFERVGSSYSAGPTVSEDTVTNYLGVKFDRYVIVDGDEYQALLSKQDVVGLMGRVTKTDLSPAERAGFTSYFAKVKTKDVWIVPLPVKPVSVGDQQYYEPERAQVADLLLQWWGVKVSEQKSTPRVIVYNGVGTPGLAGLAAQQLIRTGFRVVDSGNANNFGFKNTQILLYHGTQADAAAVRNALGVGTVVVESAPQDLTDMIVIVGADYRPPVADASTVPTEGAQ